MKNVTQFIPLLLPGFIFSSLTAQTTPNYVNGQLITFNNNGAWCWFQDERAVVDTVKQKLIIGSSNMCDMSIWDSCPVSMTIYDLKTSKVESISTVGTEPKDDHSSPGCAILPDGRYIAMWSGHNESYFTHRSIYNGSTWSPEELFDWRTIPGGCNNGITYNNIYYLSAEKRVWDFVRSFQTSPNILLSTNGGDTWKFGGRLSNDPSSTYAKGYYKYWSNGVDRIDFVCTEQHPRDFETSLYHGYIKGGKTYNTAGVVADTNTLDQKDLPSTAKFTGVFANGTIVNGFRMTCCWQHDIMRYDDGTITILFKARANDLDMDHRHFFARYDGTSWKWTYLGKAGPKLYKSEEDYTGLGALCPDDPNTIYLSSAFTPGNDTAKAKNKHEIWKGVTADHGATWKWTAITANSTMDNFRPIVPAWNNNNTALLWLRGTYTLMNVFDLAVVGLLMKNDVSVTNGNEKKRLGPALNFTGQNLIPGTVTLRYTLPVDDYVTMRIFTLGGREMAVLADGKMAAGSHTITWKVAGVPQGTYLCRMNVGGFSKVEKLTLF